ncbi:hypothetical protein K8R78_02490 [bacterium]|nr:hypothetical protein [bacterium]
MANSPASLRQPRLRAISKFGARLLQRASWSELSLVFRLGATPPPG